MVQHQFGICQRRYCARSSLHNNSYQGNSARRFEPVDYLLQIELSGTPLTTNHYLNDNLEKRIVILLLYDCSLAA